MLRRQRGANRATGSSSTPVIYVIGEGPAGLVALTTYASQRGVVSKRVAVNTIASFRTDEPYDVPLVQFLRERARRIHR